MSPKGFSLFWVFLKFSIILVYLFISRYLIVYLTSSISHRLSHSLSLMPFCIVRLLSVSFEVPRSFFFGALSAFVAEISPEPKNLQLPACNQSQRCMKMYKKQNKQSLLLLLFCENCVLLKQKAKKKSKTNYTSSSWIKNPESSWPGEERKNKCLHNHDQTVETNSLSPKRLRTDHDR